MNVQTMNMSKKSAHLEYKFCSWYNSPQNPFLDSGGFYRRKYLQKIQHPAVLLSPMMTTVTAMTTV
jgi:hypothetical protein